MERLPEDMLISILVNLPVKSLLRFRCVSKYLCNLITSREFIEMHLSKKKESESEVIVKRKILTGRNPVLVNPWQGRSVLSLHHSDESLSVIDDDVSLWFPDFLDSFFHQFLGPDPNGLVWINSSLSGRGICVCNPALREFKVIPPGPFSPPEGFKTMARQEAGIGFDPKTKGYKMVRMLEFKSDSCVFEDEHVCDLDCPVAHRTELYDLRNDSWREIDFEFPCLESWPASRLCFNGFCHWVGFYERLLCFDISTEAFRWLDYPVEALEMKPYTLLVLHQSLALAARNANAYVNDEGIYLPSDISIWVMKEYGVKDSWTKQYVIGPVTIDDRPMSFLDDNRLLLETTNGRMASYTPETKEIHLLDGVTPGIPWTLGALPYKESLVSIASLFN